MQNWKNLCFLSGSENRTPAPCIRICHLSISPTMAPEACRKVALRAKVRKALPGNRVPR